MKDVMKKTSDEKFKIFMIIQGVVLGILFISLIVLFIIKTVGRPSVPEQSIIAEDMVSADVSVDPSIETASQALQIETNDKEIDEIFEGLISTLFAGTYEGNGKKFILYSDGTASVTEGEDNKSGSYVTSYLQSETYKIVVTADGIQDTLYSTSSDKLTDDMGNEYIKISGF